MYILYAAFIVFGLVLKVPSVLAEELEYNPFLRVKVPSVRASTGLSSTDATDSDVFLELRRMKARFSNQPVWY